jgi:hypothetical protein
MISKVAVAMTGALAMTPAAATERNAKQQARVLP